MKLPQRPAEKPFRWQKWVLLFAFASVVFAFVMVLVVAFRQN